MVTVKLFGLLRLDTGVRALELEAATVGELYARLPEALRRAAPGVNVTQRELRGCIAVVNGVQAGRRSPLAPGDEIMLMSPACGG